MVELNIKLNERDYGVLWRELSDLIQRNQNMAPAYARAAYIMLRSVERNFQVSGRPRWRSLSSSTLGNYRLRGDARRKPLLRTRRLYDSMRATHGRNGARVESVGVRYAGIHQYGGSVQLPEIRPRNKRALRFWTRGGIVLTTRARAHGIRIPARPFLLLQEEDQDRIGDVFIDHCFPRE
jgi:phage gpG-like protein